MNKTFVGAVDTQEARTENLMKAQKRTGSALVDLFFKIGALRGHSSEEILEPFVQAYATDEDRAIRILQWARDVRGGAGERQIFRDILTYMARKKDNNVLRLITKVPELGRWDDLLVLFGTAYWQAAISHIRLALDEGDGLCAKWMPRKGQLAAALRSRLGWTPKYYRKRLVELTNVVEQKMCANRWDDIEFSHVPSVAHNKYRRAFARNSKKYQEYLDALDRGDKDVKVNADAVFPHDIVKKITGGRNIFDRRGTSISGDERRSIVHQWEALPNYIEKANILPIIDVSGSMYGGLNAHVKPIDVSIGLGLYFADKNTGKFKDTFLTFSGSPSLEHLKGDIVDKVVFTQKAHWGMNTNLHAAFEKVLKIAIDGDVPASEMPGTIFIISDMQFDVCVHHDDSAMKMIERKYRDAGYEIPNVVFWNVNARDNVPVSFNKKGVALVSGFSPAICKTILQSVEAGDLDPEVVMNRTIMSSRYDW